MALVNWKESVSREYKNIREAKNSQIRKEWRENWEKMTADAEEAVVNSVRWSVKKTESRTRKAPIHILNKVSPLPPMTNWVCTRRNCLAESEKMLLNIPFLGDDKADSSEFFADLLKSYDGKIAKERKMFDEEMFLELMRKLQLKNEFNLPFDSKIFELLSSQYFQMCTPFQLKQIYGKSRQNDEKLTSDSCEHALQTFKKFFCRRCYIYNCSLHRNINENTSGSVNLRPKRKTTFGTTTLKDVCGPNCFKLNLQTSNDSSEKPRRKLENEEEEESFDKWSNDEKCLFKVLNNVFSEKYCIISNTMITKTCKQVYVYAQSEIENQYDSGSSTPIASLQTSTGSYTRKPKGWSLYKRKQCVDNDGVTTFPPSMLSYKPCNHSCKCSDSDCSCVSRRNACEKFCQCSNQCSNRFKGCLCQGPCNSGKCPCFAATRECDADLCQKCGASQYDLTQVQCKNISIQRELNKQLLLAPSDVAGWGVFLKDDASKNDFIAEYVGEIISQEEADRRGKVYDMKKSSFLFELNAESVVDATHQGGKIRFANHSINPNCYAKVMLVHGDHRIGIYAKRDILPGEELFFDYRYASEQLKFVSIERATDLKN